MFQRRLLSLFCLVMVQSVLALPLPSLEASQSIPESKIKGVVSTHSFKGGHKQIVRYKLYLPEGYTQSLRRYPVLYHLGGRVSPMSYQNDTEELSIKASAEGIVRALEKGIESGIIQPMIVIFPEGSPLSMWVDSKSGHKRMETMMIKDLIPHIDGRYRSVAKPSARIIHGMSMGGFAAMLYGAKYYHTFGIAIAYDAALHDWQTLKNERPDIGEEIFLNDSRYFDRFSPWFHMRFNASKVTQHVAIRLIVGAHKNRNYFFNEHLKALNVKNEYIETNCGHDFLKLLEVQGQASFAYIQKHLVL